MSFPENDYQSLLTPDAFVVYPSKAKLFLLLAGCLVFIALAIWMWNAVPADELEYRIVAIAAWVLCALGVWFTLKRLIKKTPSLVVNQFGIFDNSSAVGAYLLRWEEIDSIYISSMTISRSTQRFLSIKVKDTDGFLSQQGALKATMMRANIKLVGAPVNISASTLPIKLEELLEIIKQKSAGAHMVAVQP